MAFDGMKIKIGVDLNDLFTGMQKAGKSLNDFKDQVARFKVQLSTSTDANSILRLNKAIEAGEAKIKAISAAGLGASKGLTQISTSSNRAGDALTNLGRVAQDAPFGFIAIQNNLNPLLESFQRLGKEAGGPVSAIKALGASLAGPAGIGIALSVVSALLLKFPDMFSSLGEAALAAKKTQAEYVTELAKSSGALETELAKVTALVGVARDETQSRQTRTNAIKELQKEYPGYLANISQENINSRAAREEIDKLTEALGRKFKVQAISNLLTAENEKLFKAQNTAIEDQVDMWDAIKASVMSFGQFGASAERLLTTATANRDKEVSKSQGTISKLTEEYQKLITAQAKGGDFKGLNPDKAKADIKTVTDVLRELHNELTLNSKLASLGFITSSEQDIQKIARVKSAIEEILKLKNAPSVDSPIIAQLIGSIAPEELRQQVEKIRDGAIQLMSVKPEKLDIPLTPKIAIDKSYSGNDTEIKNFTDDTREAIIRRLHDFGASFGKNNIGIKVSLDMLNDNELDKKLKTAQDKHKAYLTSVEGAVRTTAGSIAGTLAETLGDAFSGKNVDLFGGLFQIIGQGLKQLGEAQIAYATSLIALKGAITNPFVALAAGIAAIAAGQMVQNSIPKFADGVQGFRGGAALVGERGPEIVQLPSGSNVIPNHRLSELAGGGGAGEYVHRFDIRGDMLSVIIERANARRARQG